MPKVSLVATILLLSLSVQAASAAMLCRDAFSVLSSAAVTSRLEQNKFNTSRTFSEYKEYFSALGIPGLLGQLQALRSGSIFMDAGAGEAYAQREIMQYDHVLDLSKLKYLAVGYKRPNDDGLKTDLKKYRSKFKYVDGDYIETMVKDPHSELFPYRDQVSLMTEIFGPLSYTRDMAQVLSSYADLLEVGGRVLIYFSETKTNIQVTNGSKRSQRMTLRELSPVLVPMMTGGRLQVKEARMHRRRAAPEFETTILWLEKTQDSDSGSVNPLREIDYDDYSPPRRFYNLNVKDLPLRLNPKKMRAEDIQKEDSELYPVNVSDEFQ